MLACCFAFSAVGEDRTQGHVFFARSVMNAVSLIGHPPYPKNKQDRGQVDLMLPPIGQPTMAVPAPATCFMAKTLSKIHVLKGFCPCKYKAPGGLLPALPKLDLDQG